MKNHGDMCQCIRCREIGHASLKEKIEIDERNIDFDCECYEASGCKEVFISLVDKKHDALIGYLRLRDINTSHRFELKDKSCMIIRELKILGREIPIGRKNGKGWQHRGHGKELIDEAGRICSEEFDKKHLFVLSGIGVKEYYRKLGFKDDGVYLRKTL
jgi:elongator complex protein 3